MLSLFWTHVFSACCHLKRSQTLSRSTPSSRLVIYAVLSSKMPRVNPSARAALRRRVRERALAWPRWGRGALFQLFAEASLPAERIRHNRPAAATNGPYSISQRPRTWRDEGHGHSSATWASGQQQNAQERSFNGARALQAAMMMSHRHQRSLILQNTRSPARAVRPIRCRCVAARA